MEVSPYAYQTPVRPMYEGGGYQPAYDMSTLRNVGRLGNAIGRQLKRSYDNFNRSVKKEPRSAPSKRRRVNTRRSLNYGQQIAVSGGESASFTRYGRRKKIKTMKGLGQLLDHTVSSASAFCNTDSQNALSLTSVMTAPDITRMYTAIGQTAVDYNAAKLVVDAIRSECMITNSCSINTHCVIYDCVARRDGFTTTDVDPVVVFKAGFVDASTGIANDYLVPGASPCTLR